MIITYIEKQTRLHLLPHVIIRHGLLTEEDGHR